MLSHSVPKGLYPLPTHSSRSHLGHMALQQERAHQAAAAAWHGKCMGHLVASCMPGTACPVWNCVRSYALTAYQEHLSVDFVSLRPILSGMACLSCCSLRQSCHNCKHCGVQVLLGLVCAETHTHVPSAIFRLLFDVLYFVQHEF